jgi:hypothetical protein
LRSVLLHLLEFVIREKRSLREKEKKKIGSKGPIRRKKHPSPRIGVWIRRRRRRRGSWFKSDRQERSIKA